MLMFPELKRPVFDTTLAGLAPFLDMWVPLREARAVAKKLGRMDELAALLEWDTRKAFSVHDKEESGLVHNWRIASDRLDPQRYSTKAMLSVTFPRLHMLPSSTQVRTLMPEALENSTATKTPAQSFPALLSHLVTWSVLEYETFLDDDGDDDAVTGSAHSKPNRMPAPETDLVLTPSLLFTTLHSFMSLTSLVNPVDSVLVTGYDIALDFRLERRDVATMLSNRMAAHKCRLALVDGLSRIAMREWRSQEGQSKATQSAQEEEEVDLGGTRLGESAYQDGINELKKDIQGLRDRLETLESTSNLSGDAEKRVQALEDRLKAVLDRVDALEPGKTMSDTEYQLSDPPSQLTSPVVDSRNALVRRPVHVWLIFGVLALVAAFARPSSADARRFLSTSPAHSAVSAGFKRPGRALKLRGITSTPVVEGEGDPSHAAIDETIVHEYPDEKEFDESDLGHSTDGPDVPVGSHSQRTLASFSMEGKVCVVTGAARGLGNLMARTFAESGSNAVVIMDLDGELAKKAASDLVEWAEEHVGAKKGEVSAIGMGCDVGNEDQVKECFNEIVKKYGRVDVLVTAAGIVENFPATEYPAEKFRKLMSINVEGSFFCAREAAKDMMRRNAPGSIVMIGSMSGNTVNVPQAQAPYNASKAAVRHMCSSLAVEWATKNIRVNTISPGYMATALTRVILERDPALHDTWVNLTPMGRIGEPEDLKGAVIYFSSDASAFTTGAELLVDGGYTLT
ncbi:hypothetical protein ACM66B_005454 [Microbotryomycetes sp. NB124-2]